MRDMPPPSALLIPVQPALSIPATFARGFLRPLEGARFLLLHRGLKRYAVLPLIVNVLLYVIVIALFIWLLSTWTPRVGDWQFLGPVGAWLAAATNWTLVTLKWLIAIPLLLFFCYFTFTIVGLVLASPFNDLLSDRVERTARGFVDDPGTGFVRSVGVSMLESLLLLGRQLLWTVLALPFLLIPVVGALPLLTVTAWFAGVSFIDVTLARHQLRWPWKHALLRANRWEVLGLGAVMQMLFLVPFLGLLLLPIGVVAGTLLALAMRAGENGEYTPSRPLPPPIR